jgi:hypothetical protein
MTQEYHNNENQNTVDMGSIIRDVRRNVLINEEYMYRLRNIGPNIWTVRIFLPNGGGRFARVEIIVDEFEQPEDRGVRGAVLRYGDIPRQHIAIIMDSILERL